MVWNSLYFSICPYTGNHHPTWRSHIFQRVAKNHQPKHQWVGFRDISQDCAQSISLCQNHIEKNNDPKKSTAKLSPCWVAGQLVLQGGAPYLAFSWFISTITRVYGGYIYSYIMGFINQLITGGAPPCRLWQPHEYEKLELYGWAFPAPRRGRVKCCACCCPMIFKGNAGSLNTNPFA